jgi:uroporphyrinogen-III decarboxylase
VLDAFADRPHVFNPGHGIGRSPQSRMSALVAGGARLAK